MKFHIGRVWFEIYFYKKDMSIRGTKWFEIIDSSTVDSKGRIFSGRFVHAFVDIMSKEWYRRYKEKKKVSNDARNRTNTKSTTI